MSATQNLSLEAGGTRIPLQARSILKKSVISTPSIHRRVETKSPAPVITTNVRDNPRNVYNRNDKPILEPTRRIFPLGPGCSIRESNTSRLEKVGDSNNRNTINDNNININNIKRNKGNIGGSNDVNEQNSTKKESKGERNQISPHPSVQQPSISMEDSPNRSESTTGLVSLMSRRSSSSLLMAMDEWHAQPPPRPRRPQAPKEDSYRIPAQFLSLRVRRRAAIVLSRWWRSRGDRERARLLRAVELVQRVGRRYLVVLRLRRRNTIRKDQGASFARSIMLRGGVSALLNSVLGASIDRLPDEGWVLPCDDVDDLLNLSRSAPLKSRMNASRSCIKSHSLAPRAFAKSVRSTRIVNFDLGDAPAAVSRAALGTLYDSSIADVTPLIPADQDIIPEMPMLVSHERIIKKPLPPRRLSLISYTEEAVKEERKRNEAVCCMLNGCTALEPLSVKVARVSGSVNVADLGPWRRDKAQRSTVARLCCRVSPV
ncbi:uncharacterized protein TM35_000053320 [Trypanosoma theileri]|uniref:Uncharacterized protein n=1 Tax=Trypanosoma theileri TaxID=67003 RepID=A0A1X0P472_9TRYP|nr:uncharacterized protein TM35_000053320 [Trypanosoma theileri]ORC91736.1 hypothetical protein TM35_000053320 [Trypanosoma theileri]